MTRIAKWSAGLAAAAGLAFAAAPAQAQYYPYEEYRTRQTVNEVIGAVGAVGAAVAAATQGRYYDPYYRGQPYRYGYGYNRGFTQHAINACSWEAQRRYARYGRPRVDVRDVQWLRSDRMRVLGAVETWNNRGWNRGYDRRAFSCDVRADGRVTRFRTHNYRW